MSLYVLAFSFSSNYAKWGTLGRKRILKITGASFAHLYVNPYTQKSGERGVKRLSLTLVETCFVRYQWVQFSLTYTSAVLWTRTMLEGILKPYKCAKAWISAYLQKAVLLFYVAEVKSDNVWPLFPIPKPLANLLKLLLSLPSHVAIGSRHFWFPFSYTIYDQKGQHSVNNQNNPFKVKKISFLSFWVQIVAGIMCY